MNIFLDNSKCEKPVQETIVAVDHVLHVR